MEASSSELVAYIDSDAYPDRDWLRYLALTFLGSKHAVVGGPNLNPPGDGPLSECIDQAPGNPAIVMSDVELADHIPGCNLAVRRSFMKAIGGFDERYPGAGDDVAFCWRVLKYGGTLGVSPGAMIWHHRRPSVGDFLRQQRSYGKGDLGLARDWPERFNSLGHQAMVGPSPAGNHGLWRPRIYHALVDQGSFFRHWTVVAPTLPEWPLVIALLGALSGLGLLVHPLLLPSLIAFAYSVVAWLLQALRAASRARLGTPTPRYRALSAFLFVAQPLARLYGRLKGGMSPWTSRSPGKRMWPRSRAFTVNKQEWLSRRDTMRMIEGLMRADALPLVHGGDHEGWDWQIEGGLCGGVRCLTEVRPEAVVLRVWPYAGSLTGFLVVLFGIVSLTALAQGDALLAAGLALPGLVAIARAFAQAGESMARLYPTASGRNWSLSEWDELSPPGHFFEIPWLPADSLER